MPNELETSSVLLLLRCRLLPLSLSLFPFYPYRTMVVIKSAQIVGGFQGSNYCNRIEIDDDDDEKGQDFMARLAGEIQAKGETKRGTRPTANPTGSSDSSLIVSSPGIVELPGPGWLAGYSMLKSLRAGPDAIG